MMSHPKHPLEKIGLEGKAPREAGDGLFGRLGLCGVVVGLFWEFRDRTSGLTAFRIYGSSLGLYMCAYGFAGVD